MKKYDLLTLGEILLRLSPPINERLSSSPTLNQCIGGAELNVITGASLLGLNTGVISKLPENDLTRFAQNKILSYKVSDEYLVHDKTDDARIGVYYYEGGAYPRKPRVVYDRKYSSINKIALSDFPDEMYSSTRCFHTSGITLALGGDCRSTAIEMMKRFKAQGALISFDVNFRGNLWSGPQAKACIEEILPLVDIFFCSESTARLTFLKEGTAKEIMKSFTKDYPISVVVSTQRTVHSPKLHTFGSIIYSSSDDQYYEEEPYRNIDIVDRIGSGDAYISGALYGILTEPDNLQRALEYGNAVSALKNTIPGDMQSTTLAEVDATIADHKSTGVISEMNR